MITNPELLSKDQLVRLAKAYGDNFKTITEMISEAAEAARRGDLTAAGATIENMLTLIRSDFETKAREILANLNAAPDEITSLQGERLAALQAGYINSQKAVYAEFFLKSNHLGAELMKELAEIEKLGGKMS